MSDFGVTGHDGAVRRWWSVGRLAILGFAGVLMVLGVVLIILATSDRDLAAEEERENVLAGSDNVCVGCHANTTPGIVDQYGHSTMAAANVSCQDCHEVAADHPGAVAHEDTWVLADPTTAMCERCHPAETRQYLASRHGIPAYVAMVGKEWLSGDLLAMYDSIPEAAPNPNEERNALYALEGPAVTRFACEGCHNIGRPAPDGSVGECQQCHLRHEFSLEQARKPETCNACHIGPDHPQWEIYQESPHGIAYATGGYRWNWEVEPGRATVMDIPAATCALCHVSGFGGTGTTHDVGERLTWYLFTPVSEMRPNADDNRVRMQTVCLECHNQGFIDAFYSDAAAATLAVNEWVLESREIMQPLAEAGLLTPEPFDDPIDYVFFELWHHWGRTAKFGAWMQGPDYTQWHGAYEVLSDLAELREMVVERLDAAELTGG
ncbi:MAG: nitrate reductase [Acidimicrobiia bacterium]|nr:nitrate reductase [Acidimicrobiia bacterium]